MLGTPSKLKFNGEYMEETKKLEEETKPEVQLEIKSDETKTEMANLKKEIEVLRSMIPKKEELAEKKTANKPSIANEKKEFLLQRQFPELSEKAIKRLAFMKDERHFIETEDGTTVEKVEEKW